MSIHYVPTNGLTCAPLSAMRELTRLDLHALPDDAVVGEVAGNHASLARAIWEAIACDPAWLPTATERLSLIPAHVICYREQQEYELQRAFGGQFLIVSVDPKALIGKGPFNCVLCSERLG